MDKPAVNDYPIHPLIASRWSPRAFDPRPLRFGQLRSLLEAARWTASCFNEQPWSFLVARRDMGEEFERMLACLAAKNQRWARNAGALLIAVARRTFSRNGRPNKWAIYDVGQSVASLTLQATDLGLYVHQMAGIDPGKIRDAYGVPEGFEPVTGLAIGHPGRLEDLAEEFRDAETSPRLRKPQREFVFEGAWGIPATG